MWEVAALLSTCTIYTTILTKIYSNFSSLVKYTLQITIYIYFFDLWLLPLLKQATKSPQLRLLRPSLQILLHLSIAQKLCLRRQLFILSAHLRLLRLLLRPV